MIFLASVTMISTLGEINIPRCIWIKAKRKMNLGALGGGHCYQLGGHEADRWCIKSLRKLSEETG